MKRLITVWIVTTLIIFFISCKRELNNETSNTKSIEYSNSEITAVFSELGKIHNEGMDSIFSELERNNLILTKMPNTNEKRELMYSLINKSINKFVQTKLKVKNININQTLEKMYKDSNSNQLFGKDLVTQFSNSKMSLKYSSTYYSLLNKVDSLINNNAKEESYQDLMRENIGLLNKYFEKMQFVSSVSIAFNVGSPYFSASVS